MRSRSKLSRLALSPKHSYTMIASGIENPAFGEAIPDSPSARRPHAWQVGSRKCF
jgi:hypothetical protein